MEGEPEHVMNYYNAMLSDRKGDSIQVSTTAAGHKSTQFGTGEVVIQQVQLFKQNSEATETLLTGEMARLQLLAQLRYLGLVQRLKRKKFTIETPLLSGRSD